MKISLYIHIIKTIHLNLSNKLFLETLRSRVKYKSNCTEVFYKNKYLENIRKIRR